jgi:hypothetical protein
MLRSILILWSCSLAGLFCDSTPSVETIQAAYDQEASAAKTLHDKGLKVLAAKCDLEASGRFLCQVTFLSKDDPTQRLYFDIVSVARSGDGWALKSGLCKR